MMMNQYQAKWYKANKERILEEMAQQYRESGGWKAFSEEKKARFRKNWTRSHLRRLGWTPEAVAAAGLARGGLCAMCRKKRPLVPDHRHVKPPVPRGLLCRQCNSAIGFLYESPELCEAAARYLRHWNKPCGNCGGCLDCLREERNAE